ncbi:MAG: ATP-binding protein [Microthrixaceae bacterium]|nr:ATP-binding protein [Microthrixaceae bacterium]
MASQETHLPAPEVGVATVLWHPEMHLRTAKEQLAFFALGFQPRYHRDSVLQTIDRAAATLAISSYVVWELQRKPDILLKVWIPSGCTSEDVLTAIQQEAIKHPTVPVETTSAVFLVGRVVSHYLWPNLVLSDQDRNDVLDLGGDYLTSGVVLGDVSPDLEPLVVRRHAAILEPDQGGIKFFIWVRVSELHNSSRTRSQVEAEIIRIVGSTPHIYGTSVYAGTGNLGDYLISGRMKDYEALARQLQPRLATLGEPFIALNTDTALSTLYNPIDRIENLLGIGMVKAEAGRFGLNNAVDIVTLLESDESEFLEVKGSALDFIRVGRDQGLKVKERANLAKDAVIKACAGFLNGTGGRLVIGAVEKERFTFDEVTEFYPDAKEVGEFIVIGVDREVEGKGEISWDEFERRLRTVLSGSLNPLPDPWIHIQRADIGGLDVALVSVEQPDGWFWADTSSAKEVFFARYGNATRPLSGRAQASHMRSQPGRVV